MSKPIVWSSISSFSVNPKKTFFGLDKNTSFCFTLPKALYEEYIDYFNLKKGRMTEKIQFEINDIHYPAEIRLVMIDRSKPYKLKPEDLPKREVLQFQWKSFVETRAIFRKEYKEAYDKYITGEFSSKVIKFNHLERNIFLVR